MNYTVKVDELYNSWIISQSSYKQIESKCTHGIQFMKADVSPWSRE